MTRRPNRKPERDAPGIRIKFAPHEFKWFKRNTPGPSGKLGGYPLHENWLIDATDPITLEVELDPVRLERTIRYIRQYDKGGPNSRIRAACTPALRRAGVDPLPEWAAPRS